MGSTSDNTKDVDIVIKREDLDSDELRLLSGDSKEEEPTKSEITEAIELGNILLLVSIVLGSVDIYFKVNELWLTFGVVALFAIGSYICFKKLSGRPVSLKQIPVFLLLVLSAVVAPLM